LRREPFDELDAWLVGFKKLWEARLDRFAVELERRKKARKDKSGERRTRSSAKGAAEGDDKP
jgi:hypothetical protein